MPKKRKSSMRRVFLSHSHFDRHVATDLQTVLKQHGAETYLDQDNIQISDDLPERIKEGITWCDNFLLIWSAKAASSAWVHREWDMAYDSRKKIIPYALDGTPLPSTLENLVYVKVSDREHGDAQLLGAVFGKGFRLDPTTLFPGHWRASVNVLGMMEATYDLELRANGQVEGEGGVSQSGLAGQIAGDTGLQGLVGMRIPFHGKWSYDRGTKELTLETSLSVIGHQQREIVKIRATGREKGAISGRDLAGRTWTLRRVDEKASFGADDAKRQQVRKALQQIFDQARHTQILGFALLSYIRGVDYDLGLPTDLREKIMREEAGALDDLVAWLQQEGWVK